MSRTASTGEVFWYEPDVNTGLLYRVISGDGASARYDVAIVGDGYSSSVADQRRFQAAAETFKEGLLSVSPYKESTCINISIIWLVSPETGIDDPDVSPPLTRNTALDCSFVTNSMRINGDYNKIEAAVALSNAAFDAIYVIVNDSTSHDGAWADYVADIAFSSDLFPWGTVMAHELGHAVGTLADEYRAPDCAICGNCLACPTDCVNKVNYRTYTATWTPLEPNITKESDPALVPWHDLMTTNAFPTTIDSVCDANVIGRWEGGANFCFKIYRPREYCLMDGVTCDDPIVDDFCAVCSRAIIDTLSTYYCVTP